MFDAHLAQIVAFAARHRLPTMGQLSSAEAGFLMSYGRILPIHPAPPSMPTRSSKAPSRGTCLERPTKFELVINLKTAQARPHDPSSAPLRADDVIR